MPIWYLKRPGCREDRGIGPGIFFGGPKLPKKPPERKTSTTAASAAGPGGSCRHPARFCL
ncbi:hypothetical protein JCGZ_11927 [Jatropha curcas]|uniref:Uncharacterized protein n=1 Tax=Jatropha curcas TaxID=180498 RepID=A0A067KDZ4_JATCU|nr:hypothetical protein JCGZ_11927 [Jatropha curcas]